MTSTPSWLKVIGGVVAHVIIVSPPVPIGLGFGIGFGPKGTGLGTRA